MDEDVVIDPRRAKRYLDNSVFQVLGSKTESIIDEAKKRLAGNLCVNTGDGSGGGFTACNIGGSDANLSPAQRAAATRKSNLIAKAAAKVAAKKAADALTPEQKTAATRARYATYVDEHGKPFNLDKESDFALIKKAVVPPAYTNVTVYRDPKSSIVYRGTNAKGKEQAKYSAKHTAEAAAEKFMRIKAFASDVPIIRKEVLAHIDATDSTKRTAARVLHLIDSTFIRIGSERDTKADKKAFGASTLQVRHVSFHGATAHLSFTGKKGVSQSIDVTDPILIRVLREQTKGKTGTAKIFDAVDETDVRKFMHEVSGKDYTPKDFRTYHGSRIAFENIAKLAKPSDVKVANVMANKVKEIVANALGNTPAVSFRSYINPLVWDRFKSWGYTVKGLDKIPGVAA